MATAIRTAAELERAGDIGRCELIRGEVIMMMPAGGRHGRIAMRLGRALANHVAALDIGEVLAAETGFVIARDPDTVRAADVAFLRSGRVVGEGFIEGAPGLAVEVVSPGDRPGAVREKVAEWLDSGAEAVWVVEPRERTVSVHERMRVARVFRDTDVLDGGCVLPGFALKVETLFA